MDFRLGERTEEFRGEVRDFIDEQLSEELEEQIYRTGVAYDEDFVAGLRDRGWYTAGWPEEWGGSGHDPLELLAMREELHRREAPTYSIGTTLLAAKAIMQAGTDEQRNEILPMALRGEVIIVLGFSEPEAGSDVANAQTRAVRDGDEWVINGSKMFTTNAEIADYIFLLTRTNTDVAKHKGLTTFLVPTNQPGLEVQAVYTLSGERTNITYYSDVRVEDRWRIGEVDGGWSVMMASLQEEHSGGFGARIGRLLEEAEAWAHESVGLDDRPRIEEPDVRERLARCATDKEVSTLLQRRGAWMSKNDIVPEAEGPMSKLFSSEAMERCAEDLCELVVRCPSQLLRAHCATRRSHRVRVRFSLGTTIYAGTSEIQRNIIASRGLGLPR